MHTGIIVTRFRAIGQLGWAHDDPIEATLPGDPFLDDMVCERGFYFWEKGKDEWQGPGSFSPFAVQ